MSAAGGVRDLLILGAGVHSAEMAEIVERINAALPAWNLLGYVEADPSRAGTLRNGYPVLGGPSALADLPDACCVPDNEFPRSLLPPPERLATLIDPSAAVSRTVEIGRGCVLYPHCFVGLNARLGDRVFCLSGCSINHDDVLEAGVVLASGVTLAGSVHVEEGCYLGQGCSIRQFLRVGRGSTVGMGAVVVADVAPGTVVAGCPARVLRPTQKTR